MPDGPSAPEIKSQHPSPEEFLRNKRAIMHRINQGATFYLEEMCDSNSETLNDNDIVTVYFGTDSGNTYMLDYKGNLTNANESKRQGKVASSLFPTTAMRDTILTIGKPLSFLNISVTTPITEILAVRQKGATQFNQEVKELPIVSKFNNAFPQIP